MRERLLLRYLEKRKIVSHFFKGYTLELIVVEKNIWNLSEGKYLGGLSLRRLLRILLVEVDGLRKFELYGKS